MARTVLCVIARELSHLHNCPISGPKWDSLFCPRASKGSEGVHL
jgi:hypothetical protein